MEAVNDEIASVLTEALTGYLKILSVENEILVSSQPRQGKGAESNVDIIRRDYFQSRARTAQACLDVVPRIAIHARDILDGTADTKISDKNSFDARFPILYPVWEETWEPDEKPFLNPFSGAWIEPAGFESSGPSGTNDFEVIENIGSKREVSGTYDSETPESSFEYERPFLGKVGAAPMYSPFPGMTKPKDPVLENKAVPNIQIEKPTFVRSQSSASLSRPKLRGSDFTQNPSPSVRRTATVHAAPIESKCEAALQASFTTRNQKQGSFLERILHRANGSVERSPSPRPTIVSHADHILRPPIISLSEQRDSGMAGFSMVNPVHNHAMPAQSHRIYDLEGDIALNREMQAAWVSKNDIYGAPVQACPEIRTEDAHSTDQFHSDYLEAMRLQAQFDKEDAFPIDEEYNAKQAALDEQARFARSLMEEEERMAQGILQSLQEAKNLDSAWEREELALRQSLNNLRATWDEEDTLVAEQGTFAQELARVEEERAATIKSDMAEAQKLHSSWEQELKQVAEEQRRAAIEAEKAERKRVEAARVEAERQARILAQQQREEREAERRRMVAAKAEAEKQAKLQAQQRQAEAERARREAQEAERRARQADCVSCMDSNDKSNMCFLPCKHGYCGTCIAGAFQAALDSRSPFKCCGTAIPVSMASRHLTSKFLSNYNSLVLELGTTRPSYCSSTRCARFIPPSSIHGPIAVCPSCHTRTCVSCRAAEHAGICKEDKDGLKVQALAKTKGWKECPKCKAVVDRTEGCLHITCRCGSQWCFACRGDWKRCGGKCPRP